MVPALQSESRVTPYLLMHSLNRLQLELGDLLTLANFRDEA